MSNDRVFDWKFFKAKTIAYFFLIIFVLLVGVYAFLQVQGVYSKISTNWDALKFTYEHPSIIQTIQQDYASRSAQLERSYTTREKTPEQLLIEQVAKQLQSDQSSK